MNKFPINNNLKNALTKERDDLIKSLKDGTFQVDTKELSRIETSLANKDLLIRLKEITHKSGLLREN